MASNMPKPDGQTILPIEKLSGVIFSLKHTGDPGHRCRDGPAPQG
jgi:hypothetical protein